MCLLVIRKSFTISLLHSSPRCAYLRKRVKKLAGVADLKLGTNFPPMEKQMANQAKAVESPFQSTDVASTGAAETDAPEIVPQRDAATFLPDAKLILMAALTDSPEHLVSTHSLKKTMRKTIPPNLVDEVVWNLRQDEQSDWRHRGASFYTKDAYEQYQRAEVQEAEETADDATIEADAIDEVALIALGQLLEPG